MNETHSTRYRVRPARDTDVPAMGDLLAERFAAERDLQLDRSRQRRALSALLNRKESALLVAEQRGEVVGMVSCQVTVSIEAGGRIGWLEDLVVRTGWQGQGIGTSLLAAIEDWAGRERLRRLQLLANGDNDAKAEFFRRSGWRGTQLVALQRTLD